MAEAVRSGSFCSSVKEELMGNNRNIKSNDILVNITCTIVFVVFTFVYLYCYQADLLTAMQHVFSKGQTHYNHLIGASLITFILLLAWRFEAVSGGESGKLSYLRPFRLASYVSDLSTS